MRWQRTVLLFLIFGGLLYFVLRTGGEGEESSSSDVALLRASEEFVDYIRIENETGTIQLQRNRRNLWSMTSPIADRADDAVVTAMLRLLDPLEATQKKGGDRADQVIFRLDRPRVTATFRQPRGGGYLEQVLKVGRKNNAFGTYYAMVGDDTSAVGMVDPYVVESYLLRDASHFRNSRISDFEIDRVRRLGVATPAGRVLLERTPKRFWEVVTPVRTPADQATVNGLLRRLLDQRIERFVSDQATDLAPYGLETPRIVVRVELENEVTYTLWVGDETEERQVFASRGNPQRIFTISDAAVEEFGRTLFELRERIVAPFDVGAVESVEIDRRGARFRAERGRDGSWEWRSEEGGRRPLRAVTVEAAIKNLGVLQARSFDDRRDAAERAGLDRPSVTARVALRDGSTLEVRFAEGDAGAVAQRLPDGPVARIEGGVPRLLGGLTDTPPFSDAGEGS